ncbi:uncharacterized protein BKA55DRAFT_586028 [Fusarium redolens]|uniref:Uncharacterized protein n=1 Tax=Fusarium redolens TaxID=48865 RepID=A0A9P9JTB5_FUSRE|nr:uncharacterized protein BKA55DRAFT_586028 [Fusarium redolens]KAH7210747.1 hypothetical protein BKA55DRAFT_586028 [Fusarium redolens]
MSSSTVWTDVTSSTIFSSLKTAISSTESLESSLTLEAVTTTADFGSTTEATTATVEEEGPLEIFAIVTYNDQRIPLKGNPNEGSIASFNPLDNSAVGYTLSIEPTTNRLKTRLGGYLCAGWDGPTGADEPGIVSVCNTDYSGHEYIKCTQANDRMLECEALEEACAHDGTGSGDYHCFWTYRTITQSLTKSDQRGDVLYLGFGPVNGYTPVALKAAA